MNTGSSGLPAPARPIIDHPPPPLKAEQVKLQQKQEGEERRGEEEGGERRKTRSAGRTAPRRIHQRSIYWSQKEPLLLNNNLFFLSKIHPAR